MAVLDAYKFWIDGAGISARGTDSPQRFWRALNAMNILNERYAIQCSCDRF